MFLGPGSRLTPSLCRCGSGVVVHNECVSNGPKRWQLICIICLLLKSVLNVTVLLYYDTQNSSEIEQPALDFRHDAYGKWTVLQPLL